MSSRRERREERPSWVVHLEGSESIGGSTLAARVLSSVKSLEDIRDDSWTLHSRAARWTRFWTGWHYTLGLPAALLAAIAGISAIQDNTGSATWFAFASAGVSATITFLRPEEQEKRLDLKAGRAKDISNRSRLFLQTGMPNLLYIGDALDESALHQVQVTVASLLEELAAVEQAADPEQVRQRNSRVAALTQAKTSAAAGRDLASAVMGQSYISAGTGKIGPPTAAETD